MTTKNSLIKSIKLPVFAVFALILGLSACSNWQGDFAKIVISFGDADRAASYDTRDTQTHQQLEHQIVLSNKRETLTFRSKGTATFESYVAPGSYTVWVYSWLNNDVYAAGTINANLQAGQDNILKIPMYQAHLVRFDSKGGSDVPDQIIFHEKQADKPSNPVRDEDEFGGWYADEGLKTPYYFTEKVTESITLYAKWGPDTEWEGWWTWEATKKENEDFAHDTRAKITEFEPTPDNSGCYVKIEDSANDEWENWMSQVGYNYTATVGKTYRVSWNWKADKKPFENVTIRYAQIGSRDGTYDFLYHLYDPQTHENRFTIPTNLEKKEFEFTVPDNCYKTITFMVGEDTGSFTFSNFKVEEVTPSFKRIVFSHSKGDHSAHDDTIPYDNLVGFYDIPRDVRGNGIKEGEKYTFTFTFKSDARIWEYEKDDGSWVGGLSIILLDNSETAKPYQWWTALSDYLGWIDDSENNFISYIEAGKTVSGKITFTAIADASSSEDDANRLAFLINDVFAVDRCPTLTFTQFEFKKVSGGSGSTALTGTVSISGSPQVGQTLTANTANLGGSGTISYQWKRGYTANDASPDNIGTGSSYTLVAADEDKHITVTVTRSGYSGSVTSAAVVPVSGSVDLSRAEEVTLANANQVVYRFDLPAGKTWGDYEKITADYLIPDEDTFDRENSARAIRLYGNYNMNFFQFNTTAAGNRYAYASLEGNANNPAYILTQEGGGWMPLRDALTDMFGECPAANTWFTINYTIDGSKSNQKPHPHLPADSDTGRFIFGLGLPGQFLPNTFYIRDIKLVGKPGTADVTASPLYISMDGYDYPAFCAYGNFDGMAGEDDLYRAMVDGSRPWAVPAVPPITVTSVTLDQNDLTLTVGEMATLTPIITPDNATHKDVRWVSSNEDVVTVSNGRVTANAAGTAMITVITRDGPYATDGPFAICFVTVNAAGSSKTLNVTFTGPTEKVITITQYISFDLSKSGGGSIELEIQGSFAEYRWFIGGTEISRSRLVELWANNAAFTLGINWITVVVYDQGIPWSADIAVTVNP